ncbi:acyl-CoA dehydrogenase family protein [Pseudonocardia sp. MH-G8]|uniref:acyl-CoA dehydrogenase family protein n=1 Tax=Pseudonocardia sp. MH-G8 TaxID=1854588 RepID=UPI000B9F9EB9|nr:acyl-CoA dehydrogenase family protein [Pseudonocardia sp. MH-G8]OZM81345.1 acyl-CoA dehydrogenase [Pseudonocardia sp. MH-G8]
MTTTATATTATTPEQLIRTVVDLRPTLVAAQAETEERTYYSQEMHDAFVAAGLYRVVQPRRYGGLEFDFPTFTRLQIEMARGCVSTAWCWALASSHAVQIASYFPEAAQEKIFGDGDFRCASVAAPDAKAQRVEDGWRLDGTVRYCSGIPYSTHFMGQAFLAGLPPQDAAQHMLLYVAPRSEWAMVEGSWGDSLGLRGSGSHSIVLDDGRIPAEFAVEDTSMVNVDVSGGTPGLALHGNPMYVGRALSPFTISLAALTLGAGYHALDEFEHQMRTRKTTVPPMVPRLGDPDYQRWYGAALGKLATAEAAVLHCAEEHMQLCERTASGGEPYSEEDEQRIGIIAREAIVAVWETVDEQLFRNIGSSALRAGERFERVWRDLTMIASHRNTGFRELMFRKLAQLHLGLPVT